MLLKQRPDNWGKRVRRNSSIKKFCQTWNLFSVAAFLFLLICGAGGARAGEPERSGLFVRLGAGATHFNHEDDASAICCGEYDEWTAFGPEFSLRPGWALGRYVMLSADLTYAYQVASEPMIRDHKIHRICGVFGGDVVWPPIGPVSISTGLGLSVGQVSGDFRSIVGSTDGGRASFESAFLIGLQPRFGLDVFGPFGKHLAFGLEAKYAKYYIQHSAWSYGLYATWHGIGSD